MKFTKKPVTIDAVQWHGHLSTPMAEVGMNPKGIEGDEPLQCRQCGSVEEHGWIETLEGGHVVCPGDWIITGVQGEKYPCKPDIFQATYTRAGMKPTATEIGAFLKRCDPRLVADFIEDDINLLVEVANTLDKPIGVSKPRRPMEVFIDCEWNSYGGALITMALVAADGREMYVGLPLHEEVHPWVAEHVVPVLGDPECLAGPLELASRIAGFLAPYERVHLIADWPEDIERFCRAMITGPGIRIDTPPITMEVRRDLDAEQSCLPHNALADARALKDHFLSLTGDA